MKTGLRAIALQVEAMHGAIARRPFGVLRGIPIVAGPARLVEATHDVISGGVYAAIRLGGAALGEVAVPDSASPGLRSALNGAVGDWLAATGNSLAIDMCFTSGGRPVHGLPDATDRVCVFIHGLGCNEECWGDTYGERLRTEIGYTPLYLRYNTGLPIAHNGRLLARLLRDLQEAGPGRVRELVLIGHSMGGLVARSACAAQPPEKLPRMVICLGSPHLGAPLEQAGHLIAAALHLSDITAPLGTIADARSAGVKDLRRGLRAKDTAPSSVAYRFLGSHGDRLVTLGSSTPSDVTGDVETARLGGIGHFRLLEEPRVYEQIKRWLSE